MKAIDRLVMLLRDPASARDVPDDAWAAILSVARAEVMLGTLAHRLVDQPLPPAIAAHLTAAARAADHAQTQALWEAEMCRRALAPLGLMPVLLKGTAYAAAGLPNALGRQIGDLDILVPRDRLDDVESALLGAGWEWVKDDPYDQAYYRRWMHELPPLIHSERDRMIDVHHTILPLTAKPTPDAAAMIADAVPVPPRHSLEGAGGDRSDDAPPFLILSPLDRILHCAAHLLADGELDGGLRNLWDFHCLLTDWQEAGSPHITDWDSRRGQLVARARKHGLEPVLWRAISLSILLFGNHRPNRTRLSDRLFLRRLLARDDWGRETHRPLRLAFYIRSHWMRMPPLMLARHLWTKLKKPAA